MCSKAGIAAAGAAVAIVVLASAPSIASSGRCSGSFGGVRASASGYVGTGLGSRHCASKGYVNPLKRSRWQASRIDLGVDSVPHRRTAAVAIGGALEHIRRATRRRDRHIQGRSGGSRAHRDSGEWSQPAPAGDSKPRLLATENVPPPPDTFIDWFQINPDNSIRFGFSSDIPNARIMCRVDTWAAARECTAPGKPNPRTTAPLPKGDRTLEVWAVLNGVTDPTPAAKTFTIGVPPPPPPPPPPDSPPFLSEFVFPRNVGTPGTPLPESAGSGTGDFDGMDYGSLRDANNVNERMSWVSDPGGSGKTVTEIRLEAGDHADGSDAPSDHRAELYSRNRDLGNHRVGWQVLGFRVPSSNPSGQYGIFQNHAVADARQKTPPQNLNVNGNNLALGIRKIGENRVMHTIGSAAPNVWHYVVLHVGFDSGDNGFVEAWAADNQLPDVSQAPAFADYGYSTLNGGSESSRSHIGFYEGDVSWAGKIWYCGYHRAATFTEASQLSNCPIPTGG